MRCTQGANPLDLLVTSSISGHQVELDAVLHPLVLRQLDEQDALAAGWVDDHAFLIARLIGVAGHIGEPRTWSPGMGRQRMSVVAVERGVVDP